MQLYDTMLTRHTALVVASSGGGQTAAISMLRDAQTTLGYPTALHLLNPKSLSISELYSFSDPNTTPMESTERWCIVHDGDADAHSLESTNALLGNTRVLTLLNRERIFLHKQCSMLFEVGNLNHASPATVSRCGMVYIDPRDLSPDTNFQRWLDSTPELDRENLKQWYGKYIKRLLEYILEGLLDGLPITPEGEAPSEPPREDGEEAEDAALDRAVPVTGIREDSHLLQAVPQSAISLVAQLCSLSQALVPSENIDWAKYEEGARHMLFIFSMVWSLGGSLLAASRIKFDAFLKRVVDLNAATAEDVTVGTAHLPGQRLTLSDFSFGIESKTWQPWETRVSPYEPPPDCLISSSPRSTQWRTPPSSLFSCSSVCLSCSSDHPEQRRQSPFRTTSAPSIRRTWQP